MIDLSNEIDKKLESNQNTQDGSLNEKLVNIILNNDLNNTEDSDNEINTNQIVEEKSEETNLEEESDRDSIDSFNNEVSNCLALTVKKDYSLSVVKNVVVRSFKGIWKVAISIFTLNIIKFFF